MLYFFKCKQHHPLPTITIFLLLLFTVLLLTINTLTSFSLDTSSPSLSPPPSPPSSPSPPVQTSVRQSPHVGFSGPQQRTGHTGLRWGEDPARSVCRTKPESSPRIMSDEDGHREGLVRWDRETDRLGQSQELRCPVTGPAHNQVALTRGHSHVITHRGELAWLELT